MMTLVLYNNPPSLSFFKVVFCWYNKKSKYKLVVSSLASSLNGWLVFWVRLYYFYLQIEDLYGARAWSKYSYGRKWGLISIRSIFIYLFLLGQVVFHRYGLHIVLFYGFEAPFS